MPKIYAKLRDELDADIAAAYLAVTNDNPDAPLNAAGAKKIFDPIFGADKITPKKAEAMSLILETHRKALTNDAKLYLRGQASKPGFEASLDLGTSRGLTDAKELAGFHKAIDVAAKNLAFKSVGNKGAGTNIFYSPIHYVAIRQLVNEREIQVYRMMDSGLLAKLTGAAAEYDSDRDNIILAQGASDAEDANTVIHEVTHAIQDWLDVSFQDKYLEADAYVAGSVIDVLLGTPRDKKGTHPLDVAWTIAAPLVMDGTARTEEDKWLKAYDAVVKAVAGFSKYSARADVERDMKEDDRRPRRKPASAPPARRGSEKKNLQEILNSLLNR